MKRLLGIVMLVCASSVFAQGVDEKDLQSFPNGVEIIGQNLTGNSLDLTGVPPDDNHKWFLSFVRHEGKCLECDRMSKDFKTNGFMRKLAYGDGSDNSSVMHFNTFNVEDERTTELLANIKDDVRNYPVIIIQPPINEKFGPAHVVAYLSSGYQAPEKVEGSIREGLWKFVQRIVKPRPNPNPSPTPLPSPLPSPLPDLPPNVPMIIPPPVPAPAPRPPAVIPTPTPAPPIPIKDKPEILVIVDPHNLRSATVLKTVTNVVNKLVEQRGGNITVRHMTFDEAFEEGLPLDRDQLPAVIATRHGRVDAQITHSFLRLLGEFLVRAQRNEELAVKYEDLAAESGGDKDKLVALDKELAVLGEKASVEPGWSNTETSLGGLALLVLTWLATYLPMKFRNPITEFTKFTDKEASNRKALNKAYDKRQGV